MQPALEERVALLEQRLDALTRSQAGSNTIVILTFDSK
jgi:hypothetical protein